jgi:hypothetical protein
LTIDGEDDPNLRHLPRSRSRFLYVFCLPFSGIRGGILMLVLNRFNCAPRQGTRSAQCRVCLYQRRISNWLDSGRIQLSLWLPVCEVGRHCPLESIEHRADYCSWTMTAYGIFTSFHRGAVTKHRLRRHGAHHGRDSRARSESSMGYKHCHGLHICGWVLVQYRSLLCHGPTSRYPCKSSSAARGADFLQCARQGWRHLLHCLCLHHQ